MQNTTDLFCQLNSIIKNGKLYPIISHPINNNPSFKKIKESYFTKKFITIARIKNPIDERINPIYMVSEFIF